MRAQVKNDAAAGGIVALLLGGGLSAFGAYEAAQKPSGFKLGNWAAQDSTRMAALTSVAQIATSGAKLAITGRYHGSKFGLAADAFSAAQLLAFALGRLYTPKPMRAVADLAALVNEQQNDDLELDTRYVTIDTGDEYETLAAANGDVVFRRLRP